MAITCAPERSPGSPPSWAPSPSTPTRAARCSASATVSRSCARQGSCRVPSCEMPGCGFSRGRCGCAWSRPTPRSPVCTKRAKCSKSPWRMGTAGMWWTPGRPPTRRPAAPPQAVAATPPPSAPPKKPARHAPAVPLPARDVAYDSLDTGTIAPDMSEREVYSLWGPPIAVRRQGDMTYLYYRNGCEYTCGTEDVVFLQSGKVVDAVLRWPGHGYSGQSSSPFATPPHGPARPGGDTLTVKPSTP